MEDEDGEEEETLVPYLVGLIDDSVATSTELLVDLVPTLNEIVKVRFFVSIVLFLLVVFVLLYFAFRMVL